MKIETTVVQETPVEAPVQTGAKLFGRWSYAEVNVNDPCFKDYIAISQTKVQVYVPHTAGRYQTKKFRKAQCPIVERLVGCIAYSGRNTGKKCMAIRIVKQCFELIHLMTGRNPLDVLVQAVMTACPREDSTRIGSGGVVRKQAVDVSPMRRVSVALSLMAQGARNSCFKSFKSMSETLADEIMNAEKNSSNSFAIKKKTEVENVAKGNR